MKKVFKVLTAFVIAASMSFTVNASSISDLQDQKDENDSKKAEAEATAQQLQSEQNDILSYISELDAKVSEYTLELVGLQQRQEELQAEIEQTEADLEVAKAAETTQMEEMSKRIQYSYENGGVSYLEALLSVSDFSDINNRSEYLQQISNYDSNMLKELITIKQGIANKQETLEADLAAVDEVAADVTEQYDAIQILLDAKQTQVANYQESIDNYESLAAQYEAASQQLENEIAAAEEAQRQAAIEAAAAGIETPIYYTGGSFQWPVSSGGTISSPYGPRSGVGYGNFHYGLDIACPTGTPILAGESGTVIAAQFNASMGNYVLIDHGGGICTVYMHNSAFAVGVGTQVSRGQVIAYAGSTGDSTGPHCHFGVRINGSYVDPIPYL